MEWQDYLKYGIPTTVIVVGGFMSYARLQSRIGAIDERLTEFKTDVTDFKKEVKEDIRELRKTIQDLNNNLMTYVGKSRLVESKSPFTLTALGQDVAKYINADNIVRKYGSRVEIGENATPYEIQNSSFQFAEKELPNLLDTVDKRIVQKIAYEKGISLEEIMKVVGIKLRDKILLERDLRPPS